MSKKSDDAKRGWLHVTRTPGVVFYAHLDSLYRFLRKGNLFSDDDQKAVEVAYFDLAFSEDPTDSSGFACADPRDDDHSDYPTLRVGATFAGADVDSRTDTILFG